MRSLLLLVASLGFAAAVIQTCSPADCTPRAVTADITIMVDVSSGHGGVANFNLVKTFIANFTAGLTFSPEDSQVSIYSYATTAKSYLSLSTGNTLTAVQNAVQSIQYDNTADRMLYTALQKEETEVTAANGFRAGYKHVMIIFSTDAFTGTNVVGSSLLSQVQQKYDMVMAVGVGPNAVKNQATALTQVTGHQSYVFYSLNLDQLQYAGQFLYNYACPGTHINPAPPTTTVMPTQSPSVPCRLNTLNYDVHLIVDTSTSITAADFTALQQALLSFVNPFPVGNGQTQFTLVATSIDSEQYYTNFHNNQDRGFMLQLIQTLTQDGSTGQSLKLSLQAIQGQYLSKNYNTPNKIVVYFTGTTNFDTDPNALMKSLSTQYGVKALAVQWASGAAPAALNSFTGAAGCVYSATTPSSRAGVAAWIQTKMCNKVYCL